MSWLVVPLLASACGLGPSGNSYDRSTLSGAALQGYNVSPSQVAVAGISSGGFMAVQLHVAYSGTFPRGAAVFAGGPFYCAQDSLTTAELDCMLAQSPIDLNQLEATTDSWASSGDVDPTSNLSGAQVWLWSGTQDTTVKQPVMDALQSYYQHYGASVVYDNTTPAGHAWISPDVSTSCSAQQSPYINNCSVDAEEEFLGQFFGSLQLKNTGALAGSFESFDQNEFFDDGNANAHSLDSTGYLYVPPSCASGNACRLVVALHGCQQNYGQIGDTFLRKSGLDEWADTNDLLILYPQTTTSSSNSSACWDWWGYDDANYAKKSGRQMLAVKRMVDRITGGQVATSSSSSTSGSASSSASSSSSSGGTTGGFCAVFTDNNYNQVQAGRAYQGTGGACPMGHACAVGSNDDMGLYNTFYVTTLVESPAGYYFIGTGCPSTSGTSSSSSTTTSGSVTATSASSSSATSGSTGTSAASGASTSGGSSTGAASTSAASTGAGSTGAGSTGASSTGSTSGSSTASTAGTTTGSSGAGTTSGSTTSGASSSGAGTTGASGSSASSGAAGTSGSSGSTGTTSGHAKAGGCGSAGGAASLWGLLALAALWRRRTLT